MPVVAYADPTWFYGDTDVHYGLISSLLTVAQDASVRETALQVIVRDPQLNSWEHHAGDTVGPADSATVSLYRVYEMATTGRLDAWDPNFYSYRGATALVKLGNGTLRRIRNGNPADASDRQIWIQTITDPTNPADWATSFSVLYAGTHYGLDAMSDGTATGFIVYHTKSDGLYRNNVKRNDNSVLQSYGNNSQAIGVSLVADAITESGWVSVAHENAFDHHRTMHFYFSDDLSSGTPDAETFNYEWFRPGISGIQSSDEQIAYFFQGPIFTNPRSELQGSALSVGFKDFNNLLNSPLYPIRGIGSGAGISYMTGNRPMLLADGFYYIFGFEVHVDALRRSPALGTSTNLGRSMPVWIRSKDLKHWSEPVIGPTFKNGWGFATVEAGDYVYWSCWESVWRRPTATVSYDISNYVPKLEFELPRDNQPGIGKMTVANPAGINSNLLELSDKELNIMIGARVADGTYEYVEYDHFFMKQTTQEVEGAVNRLQLEFGNIWDRLDNQMKDIMTFVGRFIWDDFSPTTKNEPFNYYFNSDTRPTTVGTNHRLRTRGIVLATAWKGHNPDIAVTFSALAGKPRLVFRYRSARNYFYVEYDRSAGPRVALHEVRDNVDTELSFNIFAAGGGSIPNTTTPRLRLQMQWYHIRFWVNDTPIYDSDIDQVSGEEGYTGFSSSTGSYDAGYLHIEDYEYDLTMADLVRTALAMGDFHDALVSDAGTRVYAITWGPRTDIPTIADALSTSMEAEKLQLIWRNGSVVVGKFNDTTSIKTVDNRIIDSDQVKEANRRLNFAQVDGNDRFWIEVDTEDVERRARLLVSYVDIPELDSLDAITERAREELRRSSMGASPGGTTPLYFDLNRMDTITWIDNSGESKLVRIEGFSVAINQSTKPSQHQTFDLAEYIQTSDGGLMIPELEE